MCYAITGGTHLNPVWKSVHPLHAVKALADDIAIIDNPNSDDDLTPYVLNGLGSDFREIAVPIWARENPFAFEELHDLLVGHENYLRCLEAATHQLVVATNFTNRKSGSSGGQPRSFNKQFGLSHYSGQGQAQARSANRDGCRSNGSGRPNNNQRPYKPKCQICDQLGHTAKSCPQLNSNDITANSTTTSTAKEQKWLLDFPASHNITSDFQNLSIHYEYGRTNEVVLGDGSSLAISHVETDHEGDPTKRFENGVYIFPESLVGTS
ncbi:hypothetical protein F2P56_030656 [Juglans regia]|uniref:CCHC-type domain-containing protein n=1 Tax=Juglans regia TaxID=51240 RepID=A0A833TLM8_JUGRE|nr:hypothetical protein F2P56_030656 [Juglans regia]